VGRGNEPAGTGEWAESATNGMKFGNAKQLPAAVACALAMASPFAFDLFEGTVTPEVKVPFVRSCGTANGGCVSATVARLILWAIETP